MTDAQADQDIDWELEYNPRATVKGLEDYLQRAAQWSQEARETLEYIADVPYGVGRLQTCDVFPAGPGAPVHIFLHGGYWRGRDKSDYHFIAAPLVRAGITTVVANYDLCPNVTVEKIVEGTRELLNWVAAKARDWDARSDQMVASGHSAGAHLLAMAVHDQGNVLRADTRSALKHLVLMSGIYELEPVLRISVNEEVRLTEDMVRRVSPMRWPVNTGTPIHVIVGGAETSQWIRQSMDYAAACEKVGVLRSCTKIAGQNHYSIMELIRDGQSELSRKIIGLHDTARPMA